MSGPASLHDLTGRTALVTGASSGIGAAAARRLAAAGARLLLVARDRERLERVRAELEPGADHRLFAVELTDDAAVAALAERIGSEIGPLDALVQCAGVFDPKPFEQISAAELDRTWAVNVRAPFLLAQALVPWMAEPAAIVFVSSVSGHVPMAHQAAYGTTKSAVDGLARTLAVELAPRGIRVNAVAPGFTATAMNEHLRREEGRVERIEGATLAARLGRPEEIAEAIAYLVSDAAAFVYGQVLNVDGGYPVSHIQTRRAR